MDETDVAAQLPAPPRAGGPEPYIHERGRRGRGWIVALVVAGIVLMLLFGCVLLFAAAIGGGEALPVGDAVAVIHIDGTIASTGSSLDGIVTPEYVMGQLDRAEDDPSVKAVLLRVDSPGGTVAASEEIATTVSRFPKPVVVSVGDIGASGAYMIASQAETIVALSTSSVGSIGVIMQIPNVDKLLEKVGVDFVVLTRGGLKDAGSPYRSVNASDLAYFEEGMDVAYERFIELVAEGRSMEEDDVRELASGRTWMGSQAAELGLVDELGTYDDALRIAAEAGGIEGDPRVVSYDEYLFEEFLGSLFSFGARLTGGGIVGELREPAVPK